MPELQTPDGKPVEVTPPDPQAVNAAFSAAMNDTGPDEQALPRRRQRTEAPREDKPRRQPKADKPRTAPAVTLDDEARAAGVAGLLQVPAAIALMAGKATSSAALQADAVTIANAAPQIADACVQTARADPAFAARLDKVIGIGPYGALAAVLVTTGLQVARNHRPALRLPGTADPMELLTAPEQQAA